MKKVIIVGGGKVGTHLAMSLLAGGHQIHIIERHPGELKAVHEVLPAGCVVAGSGTDPAVLEATGIRDADVLAAVTGTDATNLVATSLARFEFGVPRTIARVKDPGNGWMFTPAMGVDAAVNQAGLMAQLIAEEMSLDGMTTLLKLSKGDYSLVEQTVLAHATAVGKRVVELAFPVECILVGVLRDGRLIIPHGNTVLEQGDEVIALVHKSMAQRLSWTLGG
ncbi:TrkA family potassium uptake protein [Desulfomicrobium sp. ZS1]|uniref:potassium channel family protein n=1 Tax=Desulfomicrobium sp. ZS1 TaxID=2952228 RepID=UPI0020B3CA04|nr:TrkA family potassium uptake protein [Desulfomicrobium sp. ZS1]UTF51709.1 TrkA family potassium uptake protein [Desulfomicrobium sp. ZS1]